ncbi:hypothetical protein ELQ90_02625 [Labedella phragmitis]|uniref:Cell wall-binding repeat-containing protein n=1 Tax=Labedella phragmitis TaxID=2498849 RepID=A0A3S4DP12_9MICO|nr:hypothetical protein [Labedella phragmitis]RWZ52854.1 hypothetical protein ELQ90_02625 [Labedella phragmitis]
MPSSVTSRFLLASIASLGVAALVGCTTTDASEEAVTEVVTTQPTQGATVIADADPAARAIEASRLLFESAPTVLVAPAADETATFLSAQVAVTLGVPLLLETAATMDAPDDGGAQGAAPTPDASATDAQTPSSASTADAPTPSHEAVAEEIDRLGASTVIAVGNLGGGPFPGLDVVATDADPAALGKATGVEVATGPDALSIAGIAGLPDPASDPSAASAPASAAPLDPRPQPAAPLESTVALTTDAPADAAALATARAAGVPVVVLPAASPDPLRSSDAIAALAAAGAASTILLGEAFSTLPDPAWSVRAAATGVELPGGGQHLFADRLFVALYGAPDAPVLGVLGEQGVDETIDRARKVAAPYEALTDRTVVPTLEIIATVAAGAEGDDGNYSNELPADRLTPYIDAAAEAGVYVVIDLQPGRTDFLTQAKLYESLLARPNVGLALDPEWRLEPDEKHLTQIGSVTAEEINAVSRWLADLVERDGLPPKMLVLHQFRLDMIQNRQDVDMSHPQLELLIHVDGQGGQPDKQATWRALHDGAPAGMAWGWKNFYDEDLPMLSPEQTLRDVAPEPDLVTYQ